MPVSQLEPLVTAARRSVERHGGRLIPFGHLAEGNVHLNVLDAGATEAITSEVLTAAAELGGTISAEHGIGIAKAGWLPSSGRPPSWPWPPRCGRPSTPPASSTPACSTPRPTG